MPNLNSDTQKQAILAATSLLIAAGAGVSLYRRLGTAALPTHSAAPEASKGKPVSASSVSYRAKIAPDQCDEHGRMYGGELLKLIDVSAGVVAAKHSLVPCVTISADRVIFLQEIRVSDVVHISAAVNRAWGTSMEIGVRVMRETASSPNESTYCCHAYLSFVTRPYDPTPSPFRALLIQAGLASPPAKIKPLATAVYPTSTLEQKRYLLAGRRRAHRIKASKGQEALLVRMRKQVEGMGKEEEDEQEKEDAIEKLQEEMIVEAYIRGDPDVKVVGENVVASIEGFMDPVSIPLAVVQRATNERGHGGYRKLAVLSEETVDRASGHDKSVKSHDGKLEGAIEMEQTVVSSLWTVRALHCNSKSVLFGGTLMRWIEEVSAIAARKVYPGAWSSASIDALTFKSSAQPGEVVYVRAAVVKVFSSSVEVYATATAEDRNEKSKPRVISDAFFSLVLIDPQTGRPLKDALRQVRLPEGTPAEEVARGAEKRREERLVDKRILQRVYA